MKHAPCRYKGKLRKVFCSCNDDLYYLDRSYRIDNNGLKVTFSRTTGLQPCPDCRMNPWVYKNKNDEPGGVNRPLED